MRSVIKKELVQLGEAASPAPRPAQDVAPEPTPDVRLVRSEGVVQAIEVRCACCSEITVVELEYGS